MKRVSDPMSKRISFYTFILTAGLLVSVLAVFFSPASISTSFVFAASHSSFPQHAFTTSPAQGPVGAVIVVTGSGLNFSNGTKVNLGYRPNFSNCNVVSDSQPGTLKNQAFSGWFRWPASTGMGNFQVCAVIDGFNSFTAGNYQVLSATSPQISVTPAVLNAGKLATVSGTNFLPAGTSVNLIWRALNGGQSISLGKDSVDATGAFTQTFTVPSKSSTGSYILTATAGSGEPPTLSASTTFKVNGITIVAVPTPAVPASPTALPDPTALPTTSATATSTSGSPGTKQQTGANTSAVTSNFGLLLAIALGGLLLIVGALVVGVFVVRRQRGLSAAPAFSGSSWSSASSLDTLVGGAPIPGVAYPTGSLPPAGNPGMERSSMSYGSAASAGGPNAGVIPFDPILAEAMREAQVSLFATPRPPVGEEVPS